MWTQKGSRGYSKMYQRNQKCNRGTKCGYQNVAEDTSKITATKLEVGNPMEIVQADDSVDNTILIGASMGVPFSWVWK